jgi:serine/threonine-protein kinase
VPAQDADHFLAFDDDEPEERRRRHRGGIAIFLVIALLVLGGGGYWLYSYLTQPPAIVYVSVPNVANLKDTDAFAKLTQLGLQPEFAQKPSADVAKGHAIDTIPSMGSQLEKNAKIVIEISSGPSSAVIPQSLIGNTEAGARDLLRSLGLVPADQSKTANSATVPFGHVITVSPGVGQTVAIGSQVVLTVSTGKVAVPDLRGRSVDEAKAALADLKLGVQVNQVATSAVAPGTIVDQSVPPDGTVDQGGTVVLTMAVAPPAPPAPAPSSSSSSPSAPNPGPSDKKGGNGNGGGG